jgi:hypothetical protein
MGEPELLLIFYQIFLRNLKKLPIIRLIMNVCTDLFAILTTNSYHYWSKALAV